MDKNWLKSVERDAFKCITKQYVELDIAKWLRAPLSKVLEVCKSAKEGSELPAHEHIICALIAKSVIEGDKAPYELLLSRTIGKVKDQVEDDLPEPFIIETFEGKEIQLGMTKDNQVVIESATNIKHENRLKHKQEEITDINECYEMLEKEDEENGIYRE